MFSCPRGIKVVAVLSLSFYFAENMAGTAWAISPCVSCVTNQVLRHDPGSVVSQVVYERFPYLILIKTLWGEGRNRGRRPLSL